MDSEMYYTRNLLLNIFVRNREHARLAISMNFNAKHLFQCLFAFKDIRRFWIPMVASVSCDFMTFINDTMDHFRGIFAKLVVQKKCCLCTIPFKISSILFVPYLDTSMPSFRVSYSRPDSRGTSNSSVSKLSKIILFRFIARHFNNIIARSVLCLHKCLADIEADDTQGNHY